MPTFIGELPQMPAAPFPTGYISTNGRPVPLESCTANGPVPSNCTFNSMRTPRSPDGPCTSALLAGDMYLRCCRHSTSLYELEPIDIHMRAVFERDIHSLVSGWSCRDGGRFSHPCLPAVGIARNYGCEWRSAWATDAEVNLSTCIVSGGTQLNRNRSGDEVDVVKT